MWKTYIFIIILLTGCTSLRGEQIVQNEQKEKMMNVMTKEEAAKIAKDYIVKEGLDKDCYVSKIIRIEERDWGAEKDLWIIYFRARHTINGNRIITVNKFTGDVRDRGRTKW